MKDLSLLGRLKNRSSEAIEDRAYQALLRTYNYSRLWEITQKRIIYKKLLVLHGKNVNRLTMAQMYDMIPPHMHERVEKRLQRKRIVVLKNGVLNFLTEKGIAKVTQYHEQISRDPNDLRAFERGLRRYLRLYTKGIVSIEMRDDAAKYLHYKLEEQAWKNDLFKKLDHFLTEESFEKSTLQQSREGQDPCKKTIQKSNIFHLMGKKAMHLFYHHREKE